VCVCVTIEDMGGDQRCNWGLLTMTNNYDVFLIFCRHLLIFNKLRRIFFPNLSDMLGH
jgi:hypothetical protein